MKKITLGISTFSTFLLSFGYTYAGTYSCIFLQNLGANKTLKYIIYNFIIGCFAKPLFYMTIAFATIIFAWGVFKYIRAEGDDKTAGREFIIWGIVGLFVMVSFWGLVSVLQHTFVLN